jgi:tetratricopeptide (TPR) repeat protein
MPGSGDLLRDGARALAVDGDLAAGRRSFDRAYREAERGGDGEAMALAALGLGGLWVHEQRSAAEAAVVRDRLRRALSLVDSSSLLALRLRARLAAEADYHTGGHAAILTVLEEARRAGDPVALAEALSLAHHCVLGPDHGKARRVLAQELIGEGARTGRRSDTLMGLLWQTVDLFLDADPHAERRLTELRDLLAQRDHLAIGFVVSAIEVMRAIRAGRLDQAEEQALACARRGEEAGDADATGWYGAQLVAIRWYQGRVGELLPMLHELVHSPTLSAIDNSYFAGLAVAAATVGDRRQAIGALARLRGRELAELPRSSSWLVSMYGIVEAAYLLGDAQTAAEAYELLRPYPHLPMMASLGVACFGSARHALGVACLTTGDLDRAVEHLRGAVRDNLAFGHWPAAALSRARLLQALRQRGAPGDEQAARRELAAVSALGLPAPGSAAVTCERRGRKWWVEMGTQGVLVDHGVGLLHLAALLANPGREIPAVDLAAGADLASQAASMSPQPVLDEVAKREYRQRLALLAADIDEAEAMNEYERASARRVERDWLVAELAAATGIAGRPRHFADNEERARIAVGKAIRRAIGRIAAVDPVIGAELAATVHTGLRCWYRPR